MPEIDAASDRLRVMHVLRAPLGGLFRHVVDLAREQILRGHSVGIIADSTTGGRRADEIFAELGPQLALGFSRAPMRRNPHASDVRAIGHVMSRLREAKPDVLHGHGSKGGFYTRLSGFLPGAPPVARA